ncbi:MAG TPA: TetR/AcrR family transcriptional regulator [Nevskia sp.]|jgi:AcrR family transcriptional regulator|nr:TetR/AcrR family transcriptional regulator [Nevskia sp.]
MKKPSPASTVERISEVALGLLEQGGPEAVTMRVVAQAVGITPMAIYHHFPNREALLQAVTDREFDRFAAFQQARLKKMPPRARPRTVMYELMHSYIDYAVARPLLFDYVFSRERPAARRFPEDFRARRSPTMTPLADAVEAAMAAGWLRKDDVWEVTMQMGGSLHGWLVLYRGNRFSYTEAEFRAFCERGMDRLLAGLRNKD